MKSKKKKLVLIAVIMLLIICMTVSAANVWRVDANGNITLNGSAFRVKGGSWFGLEGRYEISSDANNPRGAPMELYMGNVWWQPSSRTISGDAQEMASLGFNSIRIPVVPQTLDNNDAQGRDPVLKNTESVRIQGAYTALQTVVSAITSAGMHVLLDIHSCSNYIGWRAGRFDAKPPWADTNRDNYDFKRDDCSCAASGNPSGVTRIQAYDATKWQANLRTLAGMSGNIMGIDIFNEPWDYTWSEWRGYIDQAYSAINGVNSNILVFAQGIGNKDAFGSADHNPNWGENLYSAGDNPPTMPKERLVLSPHTYGPSVCTQDFFADWNAQPQCEGIIEDAFGDAKCQIVIEPAELEAGWEEHFGYLKAMGYAVCVGEFGGNMDWPNKAEQRHQTRYSYLTDKTTDAQWQNAFVNYLLKVGILDSFYWSINPESSDTYGIYTTPYDPISNTGGWGTWSGTDNRKLELIRKLWNASPPTGTTAPTAAPTTGPTTAPTTGPTTAPTPAGSTTAPTAAPTTPGTAAPTPQIGVGSVFFVPAPVTASVNSTFTVHVHVNSGDQTLAAYGVTVTWNSSLATLNTVAAGPQGYVSAENHGTPGQAIISGFDTTGTGPGASLDVIVLTFTAGSSEGSGALGITVSSLVDPSTATIGTPTGVGTTLTINQGGLPGDANGSGTVDIVDALVVAQYYVGLQVTIDTASADTNCSGTVDIVDALRIAQYYVGLLSSLDC